MGSVTDEELDFYAKHPVSIDEQIGQQLARELLAHRRATPADDLWAAALADAIRNEIARSRRHLSLSTIEALAAWDAATHSKNGGGV